MLISINEISDIKLLKDLWHDLYRDNKQLTIFDSYEFCKAINDDWVYLFVSHCKPKYFVTDVDGKKIIFPLVYDDRNKVFKFIHACNGGEYCSPIFDPKLNADELFLATNELAKFLPKSLKLADVTNISSEISGGGKCIVYQSFSLRLKQISERDNVLICLNGFEKYEDYNASLSKNARQNLRTAYNRLTRDGKNFEFNFVKRISNEQFNDVMQLYFTRHKERYGIRTNVLKRLYLRSLNYSSRALKYHENAAHAMIYIDGSLVGFMSGYLKDGRFIIPRLSINSMYKFYSPGVVLIDQVIKYMFDNNIQVLDLAKGDEPYKFQMGGQAYKSYTYTL